MKRLGLGFVAGLFAMSTAVACWGSGSLGTFFSGFEAWPELFYSVASRRLIEVAVLYPLVVSGLAVHLLASAVRSKSMVMFGAAVLCAIMGISGGLGASEVASELSSHQFDAGFRVGASDTLHYPVLSLVTWYRAGFWLPMLGFMLCVWCLWSKIVVTHCLNTTSTRGVIASGEHS